MTDPPPLPHSHPSPTPPSSRLPVSFHDHVLSLFSLLAQHTKQGQHKTKHSYYEIQPNKNWCVKMLTGECFSIFFKHLIPHCHIKTNPLSLTFPGEVKGTFL